MTFASNGNVDLNGKFLVDQKGFVTMKLIGRVRLAGLTLKDAEAELVRRSTLYIREPHVFLERRAKEPTGKRAAPSPRRQKLSSGIEPDFVVIGAIDAKPKIERRIGRILSDADIQCGLGGRLTYQIEVPKHDAARATQLIREDSKLNHYRFIEFRRSPRLDEGKPTAKNRHNP